MTHSVLLRKVAQWAATVGFFLLLAYGYVPQTLRGKIVDQGDIAGYVGMSHQATEWNRAHPDDLALWSNSMFGGMPTVSFSSPTRGDWTQPLYRLLLWGKRPASYLAVALLGGFLLLLALGVRWPLAVGGAVAMAFCSYNLQIIQVGHNTKMQAIAFMPWVMAAVVHAYRRMLPELHCADAPAAKLWETLRAGLWPAALLGLAMSMQVKANHPQITYYLALMVLLFALVEGIAALRRGREALLRFGLASVLLLLCGGVGIATNANKLIPLARYTPHTMRGGSDLSPADGRGRTGGLELSYATAWSYGWEELPNLMIANFNGGASAQAVNPDKSETVRLLRRSGSKGAREAAKSLPMYWGPQPFTAGPMYLGAVSVFLFVLGLFVCKGREKGWLCGVALAAILLSVGSHWMPFTRLCFRFLPLYDKFRTVSMSLVLLQLAVPMLGFLALDAALGGRVDAARLRKGTLAALCLTGGFCLLCLLAPGVVGDFSARSDAGMPEILVDALCADRQMLLCADARGALLLIVASAALLLFFAGRKRRDARGGKLAAWGVGMGICLLLGGNLLATGKRYLNAGHFVTPKDFNAAFRLRPADHALLADTSAHYRVLDLTVNVFNSSVPSYHHRNVGGYSPAKLQRYQDLIDRCLGREIERLSAYFSGKGGDTPPATPMLDALDTRYVVTSPDAAPWENPHAAGAAWFVEKVVPAASPQEEIALAAMAELSREAVLGVAMPLDTVGLSGKATPGDTILVVSHTPNRLRYESHLAQDRLAVFSEIYYPDGWSLTVDGKAAQPPLRADWTLRCARIPAGDHVVEMRFCPASYATGRRVSTAGSALLMLFLLLGLYGRSSRSAASTTCAASKP